MDATRLAFDAGTFGGVVDKGTLDATLTGGKETARRICAEAMRVLEPGGKFLVISCSGGEVLLSPLLDMCGPESRCDWPLAVSSSPDVYAYVVRKGSSCVAEASNDSQAWPGLLSPRSRSRAAEAPSQMVGPGDAPREVALGKADWSGAEPAATASPEMACFGTSARARAPSASEAARRSLGEGNSAASSSWRAPYAGETVYGDTDEHSTTFKARLRHREASAEEGHHGGDKTKCHPSSVGGGAMSLPQHTSAENGDIRGEGMRPCERLPGQQQLYENVAKLRAKVERANQEAGAIEREGKCALSLPWGVAELDHNEDELYVNFDLDLATDIRKSELSVEIKATRVRVRRGPSDAREMLLDRELAGKVDVTESTWFIQDKTVLSVRRVSAGAN